MTKQAAGQMNVRARVVALMSALALVSCQGFIGDSGGSGGGAPPTAGSGASSGRFRPPGATMFRLTRSQYRNGIKDVFGSGIGDDVSLETDESTELFSSIGAAKVGTSGRGVEQYRDAGLKIAKRVFAKASSYPKIGGCKPKTASDSCVADYLKHYALRLWRRPMTSDELARYQKVVGSQGKDELRLGMQYALAAMLMSPNFLYVAQIGEPANKPGLRRLSGYEIATRLALFVWDSLPDETLLEAAAAGDLDSASGVAAQAKRMLRAQRARTLPVRFFGEAWNVDGLDVTDKSTKAFPGWKASLVTAFKEEFRRVLQDLVFERDGDLRDLFDGNQTFVNGELASLYSIAGVSGSGYQRTTLGSGRSGLLTSAAVIAANSPSDRTSPTRRGVFVLERLLCEEIPAPPANVKNALASSSGSKGKSLREQLESHRDNPACAGCHKLFDPAGFTFEHYDAIGRYRRRDQGVTIDASGTLSGTELDGVDDLAAYLRRDKRTGACIAKRLFAFAVGHEPKPGEKSVVERLTAALVASGYSFQDLVAAVVRSDGFRYVSGS